MKSDRAKLEKQLIEVKKLVARGLKSIVADLHDLGYTDAEIAIVVDRSPRHVGRILNEVCPRPPKLTGIDDLPFHMKQRVLMWKESDGQKVTTADPQAA